MNTYKLQVPYHSQFLEVEDGFWNIRSCGGACMKMCLDYFNVVAPSILGLMNEARDRGGYDISNGFIHDYAVNYFKNSGLESYRKEGLVDTRELVESLKNDSPVIVSIIKRVLEQTKYHLVLVVGFKEEEGKITHIIYHEPESTDESRGSFRECDMDTFMSGWRGKGIFVNRK